MSPDRYPQIALYARDDEDIRLAQRNDG